MSAKKITMKIGDGDAVDITGAVDANSFHNKELKETCEMIVDLLTTHWTRIQKTLQENEDPECAVALGIKLDHSSPSRMVRIKISYAVKHTDEAEFLVRDPAQTEIQFPR